MLPTQQTFDDFLAKSVNLSPEHISEGSVSHTHIRDLLQNKADRDSDFPWLVEGDFLSGSYARGTKIYPLDDIDVVMVIDGTGLYPIRDGALVNAEVRGSGNNGSPVSQYTFGPFGHISSKTVLEVFRDALKESYPGSEIRKDGQAVNVWLESKGLGLDIVPAFHIVPRDGTQDYYFIPQGGESHQWLVTNPKIDQQISDWLNDRHNGKLKTVIKLIKYWNQTRNADRLRTYHLEVIAWKVFHNHPDAITDYAKALHYFFNNAAPHLIVTCPDVTGLGGDLVDKYLSQLDRFASLQQIEATKKIINAAMLAQVLPLREKHHHWKQLFGDQFGS